MKLIQKKEITKQNNNKTIKTESKTINVNDFSTLNNALSSMHSILTINIKSDIKLTQDIKPNKAIKTLTIGGNGKTLVEAPSF